MADARAWGMAALLAGVHDDRERVAALLDQVDDHELRETAAAVVHAAGWMVRLAAGDEASTAGAADFARAAAVWVLADVEEVAVDG